MEENIYLAEETPNPYEVGVLPKDDNQKKIETTIEGIIALASGQDLAEKVKVAREKNVTEIRQDRVNSNYEEKAEVIGEAITQIASSAPDQLSGAIGLASEQLRVMREESQTAVGAAKAAVDQIQGADKMSDLEKRELAVDIMAMSYWAERMDEQSLLSNVGDFIGMALVPDMNYNFGEIGGEILGEEAGLLDSIEGLKKASEFRSTLSPEDRNLWDAHIFSIIEGVDDNAIQQYEAAMAYLNRSEEVDVNLLMEKVDLAAIGIGTLSGFLRRTMRGINAMTVLGKGKKPESVQKVREAVLQSEKVAEELNIRQEDAATTGVPIQATEVFEGRPKGAQEQYRKMDTEMDIALAKAMMPFRVEIGDMIDPKLKENFNQSFRSNFNLREELEDITFEETDIGIRAKGKDKDGNIVEEEALYTINQASGFLEPNAKHAEASVARWALSPNFIAGKDKKLFVQNYEAMLYSEGLTAAGLRSAMDAAVSPIKGNVKSLDKVYGIMSKLNGKVYDTSYNSLVRTGVDGVKLNEAEFNAFKGLRRMFDELYELEDKALRRELEIKGIKEVDMYSSTNRGKPYDTPDQAFTAWDKESFLYDIDEGVVDPSNFSRADIDELYGRGKVVVRNDSTKPSEWFEFDGEHFQYAIVPKENVHGIQRALSKVDNYMPVIRPEANWFVKGKKTVRANGKDIPTETTIAWAQTRTQALDYIEKMKSLGDDTDIDLGTLDVKFDREFSAGEAGGIGGSGLIRGKRKQEELPFAGDYIGKKEVDVYSAMNRYLGHASDRMNLSVLRAVAKETWLNQASLHNPSIKSMDWMAARSEISAMQIPRSEKKKLLSLHSQVTSMMKIPHSSDLELQSAIRAVGESFDRRGTQSVAKFIYGIHDKSPSDLMKSAVFHLTLGMGNVAQVFVQAAGAIAAYSVNPTAALKATPKWMTAAMLDLTENKTMWNKTITKMTKSGVIEDDIVASMDYHFWRKSGMRESVLRGNADAASVSSGLPYDASILRRGWSKALEVGQTPYNMGEITNMRISFFTALEAIKSKRGDRFSYSQADLREVIARAEQYRLNMGAGNKAPFQKGIAGLPTQFKQIFTKYYETLRGDWFTGREKSQLILGQAALFGSAGVPFLNFFGDMIAGQFLDDSSDVTAEQIQAAKYGAIGWLLNDKLGIDADVSGRITINSDLIGEVTESLAGERSTVLRTALGASYSTGSRALDLWNNVMFAGKIVDASPDLAGGIAAFEHIIKGLANLPASTRNLIAGLYLAQGKVMKSDGTVLYETVPEIRDVVARSLGFQSLEVNQIYDMKKYSLDSERDRRAFINHLVTLQHGLVSAVEEQDEKGIEYHQSVLSTTNEIIDNLPTQDARAVRDGLKKKLSSGTDFKERAIREAMRKAASSFEKAAMQMNVPFRKELDTVE